MSSSTENDKEMKKFLFDNNDFDADSAASEEPSYSEDQILLAREQSFAQGREEGLKEADKSREKDIERCLHRIAEQAERLMAGEDRRELEQMIHATKLAMRVTHKLLPQFSRRFALTEIERVIIEAVEARRDEPRVAVTVPTEHLETLRGKIDELALERGFAGKIILIADDALSVTDCRVEWADGGAERLYERLFSQIEGEFAKAIAAMSATQVEADATQITPTGEK